MGKDLYLGAVLLFSVCLSIHSTWCQASKLSYKFPWPRVRQLTCIAELSYYVSIVTL